MMLPSVPAGKTLEIKKSTSKKLSTYFASLPDGLVKEGLKYERDTKIICRR